MQCEKTGCIAYSDEYNSWMLGDLYRTPGGTWILKTASVSYKPIRDIKHITFHEIDAYWTYLQPWGVVICSNATYHGYIGVPVS